MVLQQGVTVEIWFIWIRPWTNGGLSWTQSWNFRFNKTWEVLAQL